MISYYRITRHNLPRLVLQLGFIYVEFKLSVNLIVVCVGEQLLPATLAICKYTVNLKANIVQSRLLGGSVSPMRCSEGIFYVGYSI